MSHRFKLILAFAILYVVWGSTYLAIRFAVETMPPFLMMGVRFLIAGLLLFAWTRRKGGPWPRLSAWRFSAILGLTMIVFGTGLVGWAETYIPSGLTALIISISPIWMVLFDACHPKGQKPSWLGATGVAIGLAGTIWLIGPDKLPPEWPGFALGVLILATFSWTSGAIYARHSELPGSRLEITSMQMASGGFFLIMLGMLTGEAARVDMSLIHASSLMAFAYLVLMGSLLVFPVYLWLMKTSTPAMVSTHAYVNPVVALLLGWALADEIITPHMLLAACVILVGVALISLDLSRTKRIIPKVVGVKPPVKQD